MSFRLMTLVLVAVSAFAAQLGPLRTRLQEQVEAGRIQGAVALVAQHGKILAIEAVGQRDLAGKLPMEKDTIVQVMSQTKTVTAVAAMMLVDEGKLDLTRPVEAYLPEFKGQVVEEKAADGTLTRHPPKRPVTVMQLLSHTSGLPFLPAGTHHRINFTLDATLAEAVKVYGKEPLGAEPGTRYLYSNMGIATIGRVVEVLSGMEYSQFVKSRILDPLGMKDSFFFPPADRKSRIAIVYTHDNGKLAESGERAQGGDVRRYRAGAKYAGPELAMFSTAEDLFHFYQMLANKGEWGGRRLISRQAVAAMTQDYSPNQSGYGLGIQVRLGPGALLGMLSPGSFGHGGAFGTAGWVDPAKDLVIVFLTQMTDGAGERARAATIQIAEAETE